MANHNRCSNKIKIIALKQNSLSFPGFPGLSEPCIISIDSSITEYFQK